MTQDAKPADMPDEEPDESETEQDVSELARSVVQELEPGTMIEDKLILSRRQALAIATGTVSASALLGFATGTADAQSAAGQVGTASQPVDVEGAAINAANVDATNIDGANITATGSITENGQDVISSPDDDYEIQKNGSDGTGIINFKT